jgi:hypothetical protein
MHPASAKSTAGLLESLAVSFTNRATAHSYGDHQSNTINKINYQ